VSDRGDVRRDLSALSSNHFDIAIIGGGVCGAAAAWDAAQRGLSVALLERGDFGEATSANSLKVVHGGIRYLQHLDLVRVRESSRERSALLRMAPHLVEPMPVLVPAFGHGAQGPEALAAAFLLLNLLTSDRNRGLHQPGSRVPPARLISRSDLLRHFPEIGQRRLTGAGIFWDGRLLNPPRLVWSIVRTASEAGAITANYCEVESLLRQGDRIVGLKAVDRLSLAPMEVRARLVINAAGPFAEQLLVRSGLQAERKIPLSRDMALVVARRPGNGHALALPTRYRDPDALLSRGPRHLFLVPWHDVTLVGVHSAIFAGQPDSLSVTEREVRHFLQEINEAAPWLGLTMQDVAQVYAGLLPAGAAEQVEANVSFGKRSLLIDHAASQGMHGLVTAVTNRFTTARGVAARAVDLAARKLGSKVPRSRTAITPVFGAPSQGVPQLARELIGRSGLRLESDVGERIARNHGTNGGNVLQLIREIPHLAERLGPSGTLAAEVVYATRHELASRLEDCVFRRTDLGTAGHPGEAALRRCAELMAGELGWSPAQQEHELVNVRARFPARSRG
jgi:glycerol-3-phosphate dehydrogenase